MEIIAASLITTPFLCQQIAEAVMGQDPNGLAATQVNPPKIRLA